MQKSRIWGSREKRGHKTVWMKKEGKKKRGEGRRIGVL